MPVRAVAVLPASYSLHPSRIDIVVMGGFVPLNSGGSIRVGDCHCCAEAKEPVGDLCAYCCV